MVHWLRLFPAPCIMHELLCNNESLTGVGIVEPGYNGGGKSLYIFRYIERSVISK